MLMPVREFPLKHDQGRYCQRAEVAGVQMLQVRADVEGECKVADEGRCCL